MNAKKQRRGSGGGGRRSTKANKAKRKPKYLSPRLQFPANESDRVSAKQCRLGREGTADEGCGLSKVIIDLAPVEQPAEEEEVGVRDSNDHENDVARFFSPADGGATSLSGLLDDSFNAGVASCSSDMNNSTSRLDSPPSASLTYAYNDRRRRAALVRHALRSRERGSGKEEEEKWVCYSEVEERKQVVKEELEVSSSSSHRATGTIRRLSLKLDYQEIMNAWSDKAPLYIDAAAAESSQIVPDVNDDHHLVQHEASNNGLSWGCNMGVWTVPEMVGDVEKGETRANENDEQETKMMGQREASVLRYKEKRQNRLFSKTVRYQVRKLNAEKRPRIKGRFVKRD